MPVVEGMVRDGHQQLVIVDLPAQHMGLGQAPDGTLASLRTVQIQQSHPTLYPALHDALSLAFRRSEADLAGHVLKLHHPERPDQLDQVPGLFNQRTMLQDSPPCTSGNRCKTEQNAKDHAKSFSAPSDAGVCLRSSKKSRPNEN